VDGNKRIGHAALETFLVLNGHQLNAGVDEQEDVFLRLAAGTLSRDDFTEWVRQHLEPLPGP
jgi:death-on-curing protein